MTTITIPRALLEQALEALTCNLHPTWIGLPRTVDAVRAALAKPVEQVDPVAWMDDFGNTFPLGANKGAGSWMTIHQRNWKPLYLHPPTPAWHDAPEVAALKAERDELLAALKAMYSEAIRIRCSIHQKWLQIMNTASAAIAKAEGGAA